MFQPFFVTCVTCGSRLRVGRPELVGNIVGCPKCQSMVQLTPPDSANGAEPAVALGNAIVDSGALTEDSISRSELPPGELDEFGEPHDATEPPPVFKTDPEIDAAGAETQPADMDASPPPTWQSEKTAKSRKIAMLIAVIVGSIISATIMFSVFFRDRDVQIVSGDPRGAANEDIGALSPDASDESPEDAATTDPGEAEDPQDKDVGASDSGAPNTTPAKDEAAVSPDDTPNSDDEAPNEAAAENAMQAPFDLLPQNPLLPANPLESVIPANPNGVPAEGDGAADESSLTELPPELRSMLDGLGSIDRPQFENTRPAPETMDEIQVDRAADVDVNLDAAVEERRPINMRQALGLPVAMQAADKQGYPLNDWLLVLSELSGVPFEVEWVSLDLVGMPIDQRVQLPKSWATLEEGLTAVCGDNGLTFDKNPYSITVRPTDERFATVIDSLLDMTDLADGTESAVATARVLLGQQEGDPSKVSIPSEAGPQQLAALVCESIRRIRGQAGKIPDVSLARWAGPFQRQVAQWPDLADGVSGPVRVQSAAFVTLLRQIAKQNGATCYINWQDVAMQDLKPIDDFLPDTGEGISAATALRAFLEPQKLHVRVVDSGHWWVGSQASFDRFPVVVWFDKAKDPAAMSQRVGQILRGAATNEEIIGAVTVDQASKVCIAIMPRYLLRQLPRLLEQTP